MQARVSMRVRKWDEFFQFDSRNKSGFFSYIENELNKKAKVKMIRFEEEGSPEDL